MRRRTRAGGGRQVELTIETMGGRGDGVAMLDPAPGGRPVFVPGTLPGDRVLLRLTGERAGGYRGEVLELLAAGPGRTEPPCPHFGPCGGCALQHWARPYYVAWKAGLVGHALARHGFDQVPQRPMVQIPLGTRRRAALAAVASGGRVTLGFHGRASHRIEDIQVCSLLTPALLDLLAPLRELLGGLLGGKGGAQLVMTDSETGIDLLIGGIAPPDLAGREAMARFAETADLAHLSWSETGGEPEPVVRRRGPTFSFAGVSVEPGPGGFVQPTVEGEAALVSAVLEYLGAEPGAVADLFAGCGTFTFPALAGGAARLHAVEGDPSALAALGNAARRAGLAGRVTEEVRDLERRPLLASELDAFQAVIFDPPRAGAKAQVKEIAASRVQRVVAVSCNPNSFARDARVLVDGGYRLVELVPIDQFPWSSHLELVALFRR